MQTLKLNDYKSISEQAEYVSACSPSVNSSGQFIYGANNYPSTIYGITEDYLDIRKISLEEGSMFTPQDVITSAKVCLIGKTITDNLFPNGESPIGKVIRFNKIPLKVIGTLAQRIQQHGYGPRRYGTRTVYYGTETHSRHYLLARYLLFGIVGRTYPSGNRRNQRDSTENHKIKEGEDDDFEIRSQEELSSMLSSTTDMMTILPRLHCRYIVISRRYRNHEYHVCLRNGTHSGNRVAHVHRSQGIGDILAQFLIEAVLISVTGGIIGVVFGVGASVIVNVLFKWPVYVQAYSVILSFFVCTITGIFFGWYPARKAANLDPIEAIRYE